MQARDNLPTRPIGRLNLNLGLWLVNHRISMKRLLAVALALVSVGLYGYSIFVFIGLVQGQAAHREMLQELTRDLIDYQALRPLMLAKPLAVGSPVVLPAGGSRVDLAIRVVNPNEKFRVRGFTVRFFDGGKVVGTQTSFLNPGESKYVIRFGTAPPAGTLSAQLEAVDWYRVNPDEYASLRSKRLQLAVTNVVHQRADELGPAAKIISAATSFTAVNNSLFGLWDAGFYILLMNGDQLVAANFAKIRKLDPGARQTVSVSWPQVLPLHTAVNVVPEVNVYDPGVFYTHSVPTTQPR